MVRVTGTPPAYGYLQLYAEAVSTATSECAANPYCYYYSHPNVAGFTYSVQPPLADLQVGLALVEPGAPPAGAPFRVTATLTNAGPNEARQSVLYFGLYSGVTITGLDPSTGTCEGSVCQLGTLPSGTTATVDLTLTAACCHYGVQAYGSATEITDSNGAFADLNGPAGVVADLSTTLQVDAGRVPAAGHPFPHRYRRQRRTRRRSERHLHHWSVGRASIGKPDGHRAGPFDRDMRFTTGYCSLGEVAAGSSVTDAITDHAPALRVVLPLRPRPGQRIGRPQFREQQHERLRLGRRAVRLRQQLRRRLVERERRPPGHHRLRRPQLRNRGGRWRATGHHAAPGDRHHRCVGEGPSRSSATRARPVPTSTATPPRRAPSAPSPATPPAPRSSSCW